MDIDQNEMIQSRWDNINDWYQSAAEISTVQGTVTCAVMTNSIQADKVLEVACGPGRHSILLASSFLKQGATLVSCDFCKGMV